MLATHRANCMIARILMLGMIFSLVACAPAALGGQVVQPRQATATEPATAVQFTPHSVPATGAIQITDAAGRNVTLDKVPQRIVVVGRASHMVLHALHLFPVGRDRLVGFDKKTMTSIEFLQLVDANLGQRTILEGTPGVEQIAALQPDLVLMKSPAAQDITSGLETLCISVAYLGLETPALFEKDVANLGVLLGSPDRAREIAAFYGSREERVQQALQGIADGDKPRVLLCQYSAKGNDVAVSVPAEGWMQTIQVQEAGGIPVWLENAEPTNGWKVVNLEQVVQWNPDQIVVVAYGADPQEVVSRLRGDPVWSALDAVAQGRLHVFPSDYFGWDMGDPRWVLGLEWLATRFYPDRFTNLNMADEARQFFGQLYGISTSAVDTKIMPKLKLDAQLSGR